MIADAFRDMSTNHGRFGDGLMSALRGGDDTEAVAAMYRLAFALNSLTVSRNG